MNAYRKLGVVALGSMIAGALGCGGSSTDDAKHNIFFMGSVIDGAAGMPLTGYDISLVWGSNTSKGKVDANGRFVLGPLPAWNDYGVLISLQGYRPFSSYNAMIAPPAPAATETSSNVFNADTTQTFDFDAYLFPTPDTLGTPAATITILETGATTAPSGTIRLQPTSQSQIQAQAAEVGTQVWTNDQDLLAATVSAQFTGGSYPVDANTLLYGVNYGITVFTTDGYVPSSATTIEGGVETTKTVTLALPAVPALAVTSTAPTSLSSCVVSASTTATSTAQVVITFNEPVQDATATTGGGAEVLDDGLFVDTSDATPLNANVSTTARERGTQFTIAGNTLTISWSAMAGLTTQTAGDAVEELAYENLGAIVLQPVNHPELKTALSTLLGVATIICQP